METQNQTTSHLPSRYGSDVLFELPRELKYYIFRYMSVLDLANARLVCKRWKDLSDQPLLWIRLFKKWFPEVIPEWSKVDPNKSYRSTFEEELKKPWRKAFVIQWKSLPRRVDVSSEIYFNYPLTLPQEDSIKISNFSVSQRLAFKVKTTTPTKYAIKPKNGIINFGETKKLRVVRYPDKDIPTSPVFIPIPPDKQPKKDKDKFLVLVAPVTPEILNDINAVETSPNLEKRKILCFRGPKPQKQSSKSKSAVQASKPSSPSTPALYKAQKKPVPPSPQTLHRQQMMVQHQISQQRVRQQILPNIDITPKLIPSKLKISAPSESKLRLIIIYLIGIFVASLVLYLWQTFKSVDN